MPQVPDAGSATQNGDATSPWVLDEELEAALADLADEGSLEGLVTDDELTDALEGLASTVYLNVTEFGTAADGVTDDAPAIQEAITEATAQGLAVYLPAGTYGAGSTITCPSNTTLLGAGVGATILQVTDDLSNTATLFENETNPSAFFTYTDNGYLFRDFTVDGGDRSWTPYLWNTGTDTAVTNPAADVHRNADWSDHGYIFNWQNAYNMAFERIQIVNHGDLSILISGCKNVRFLNCRFKNNGRIDASTACIHVKDAGVMKKITNITNAADGVIETDHQVGSFTSGTIYLKDIDGMSLPDGSYTIKSVAGVNITIEDNTTALGTFKDTGRAKVGRSGWTPSEDILIHGCHFEDVLRNAIGMVTASGGLITNCYFDGCGESAIFALRGDDVKIVNNTIRNINLTDISGHGVEANLNTDLLIQGNTFENADLAAIAHFGGYGTKILDNTIRNCAYDDTITYPYGPDSEGYATGADYPNATPSDPSYQGGLNVAVDSPQEFSAMQISSFFDFPIKAMRIAGNRIINDPANPDMISGLNFNAAGTVNISEAVTIDHNDLTESGLAGVDRIVIDSSFLTGPGELLQRDNHGLNEAYVDHSVSAPEYGQDYRSIFRSSAQPTTAGASATKYLLTASASTDVTSGTVQVQGAAMRGIVIFYWRATDYPFPGSVAPYFKIVGTCTAGTAPAVTATIGLYPYTISGGVITLGTAVATAASGTITAQDTTAFQSTIFSAPADGPYILGHTLSGTPSAIFDIQAAVQVKGVAE